MTVHRSPRALHRSLTVLALVLTLAACTPEELTWWTATQEQAKAQGAHCPEVAPLLAIAGLPDHFDLVIWRESQCEPTAVNRGTGALGLTQVMPFWLGALCPAAIACTHQDLLDPVANLLAAAYIFSLQGWSAWSQTA